MVLIGGLLGSAGSASSEVAPILNHAPLGSLAEVLSLTNDEASRAYPVHLRAQVTISIPKAYWLFLQDKSFGIFAFSNDTTVLHSGDWIEADGVTARGGFAPTLTLRKVRVLGNSPLPAPFRAGDPAQHLPEAANLWAIVHGRILRADFRGLGDYPSFGFDLDLNAKKKIKIVLSSPNGCNSAAFVDADVVIRGVLGTISAGAEHRQADALYVPTCQDIQIVRRPPEDWSPSLADVGRLLTYRSGTRIDDMVRVRGVVTFVRPSRLFFVQNGISGILVDPMVEGLAPAMGQSVEVLGRLAQDEEGIRRLVNARFRPAAVPEHFAVRHLTEQDFVEPRFAGALVDLQGEVLARQLIPGRGIFGLRIGQRTVSMELSFANGIIPAGLPEVGDRAKVTGIAQVREDMDERRSDITLELRSASDIEILAKRPIVERIPWGRVSMAAIALACGAFFWISALRHRVLARTSQLEEANRRAEKARQQAEQANLAKSQFLANMSHEIRTPMNGILGMTESALETPLNSEQKELIETAHFSAESLLIIINDILDFSKIEAGKLELDPVPFSLRKVLTKRLKIHKVLAERKGIKLSCNIHPAVPNTILSDPTRLAQVVTNLLGNALKFTAEGEIELNVNLEDLTGDMARLHFSVRDTGIGIPADKKLYIFEAFSQADASTTRKFGGTGLGLTISSKLVKMLGGNLWVESEPGKGSCFHFTIAAEVIVHKPEAAATVLLAAQNSVGTLQILLAEDNPVNQKVALRMLQKQGHSVTVAGNGKIALEIMRQQSFDLALMDVQMPEMDGLEATRAIRLAEKATGKHLPIIALTAHAMSGDREHCLMAGMDGYASKPIRIDELNQEIARVRTVYGPESVTSPA